MDTMTCRVLEDNENGMKLEVVEKTTDGVVVDIEREQKIKELARAMYTTMEQSFGAEKKELTAEDIAKILLEDECLRADVLNRVLTSETEKQMIDAYLEDVDVDELDDDFYERVGKRYVEDNASDIVRDAYRELSSYEQKDFIKDCIDEM